MEEQDLRFLGLSQGWEGILLVFWLGLASFGSFCCCVSVAVKDAVMENLRLLFIFFWTFLLLRTILERVAVSSFAPNTGPCFQHFLRGRGSPRVNGFTSLHLKAP